ncbi:transposase, IS4 family protein [Nostoc punctiforme PCC 73102]|uniref:Transposase, IS4 family protein n=1 Tax=Nostoc punctiforme (strain ATCC 29133 / PCC 73102) TaxID=63737 RepID=B2J1G3_NOSP7|nr:transposase, IS4 family protein [Nostoc punctiforme PCC 73102]
MASLTANIQTQEERKRSLPAQLVVSLVIAMSLWSKDSMRDVLKNLIDGLSEAWLKVGKYWRVACKSAITQARQRLGARVMCKLFHQLVKPMATQETLGAFLQELRIVVIDGSCFDVPDSDENARVFGRPGSRPGTKAAFPKVRLVILVEAGTHIIFDALMWPYRIGERVRALRLLRSVTPGMLLMWDRGLHSYAMVQATVTKGCDYLGRIPANIKFIAEKPLEDGSYLSWIYPSGKLRKKASQPILVRIIEYTIEHPDNPTEQLTYRLITSLLNIEKFPAELLAREYHQRWEVENTIDELKIHLLGRKTHVRSQKPREVVQEVYAWLLGHWTVRLLMFQAATSAGVAPLRLSFTGTLRVIRRAVPKFQRLNSQDLPLFLSG